MVSPGDVMAVAINVYAVPYAFENMQDVMLRALYGVGWPAVTLSRDTGKIVRHDREQVVAIPKANGKLVDVAALINNSVPHISAVVGSRCNAVNLPQILGDDFISHPSPITTAPWAPGTIQLGAEWTVVAEDSDGGRSMGCTAIAMTAMADTLGAGRAKISTRRFGTASRY